MHEKDHLDRMLESSLSNYGDSGADSGLAERILGRVSSETKANKSAPGWRNRFVLWAALPAAACLLLTVLLLKSAGPPCYAPIGSFRRRQHLRAPVVKRPELQTPRQRKRQQPVRSAGHSLGLSSLLPDLLLGRSSMYSPSPIRFRLKNRRSTPSRRRFLKSNVKPC